MKTIVFTHQAAKDLDALADGDRDGVLEGLTRYATTGAGDVKRLQGRDGYRLRAGSSRVLFAQDSATILAIYTGRRATTTYRR